MIAATAVIHPGVVLAEDAVVEDFCIIGAPFKGQEPGTETRIGKGALIRSHTVIYAGNVIGDNFQTGNKANIRECNRIGANVSIGTLSVVEHHVEIGDGVRIHTQAFVPEYSVLEEGCWLGPQVTVTNAKFPLAPEAKSELRGATVRRKAKVGAGSVLLPGVEIGANALVGAGSVVTRDVEPDSVCAGNPARFIRKIHY